MNQFDGGFLPPLNRNPLFFLGSSVDPNKVVPTNRVRYEAALASESTSESPVEAEESGSDCFI